MDFNLYDYLDPVEIDQSVFTGLSNTKSRLVNTIEEINKNNAGHQDIQHFDLALLGIPDESTSLNTGCSKSTITIRTKLYSLFSPCYNLKMLDLGNLKTGKTTRDTCFGLSDVLSFLIKNKVIPILIGGTKNLIFGNYLAYEILKQNINMVSIDSAFDLNQQSDTQYPNPYLSNIILHKAKYLSHFTHIGHQTYLVAQHDIDLMKKLKFEALRLGEVQEDIQETEPLLRDADVVNFSISSIQQCHAPGNKFPSPNGFTGQEACQLAKYSGISDKVSLFAIYEVNPDFDINFHTSHLAAQIIWYFIDGFYQRKADYPVSRLNQYKKFIVHNDYTDRDIIFYKSPKSQRWWVEVPFLQGKNKKPMIAACSFKDYQMACNHEIPTRWWNIFQRISS